LGYARVPYRIRSGTARIDYLFVSEGIGVDRVIVPTGPDARLASDHLPVIAELSLPEGGGGPGEIAKSVWT